MAKHPYWARTARTWVLRGRASFKTSEPSRRLVFRRLAEGWSILERDTWPELFKRAAAAGQDLDGRVGRPRWGRGGLPALILEAAFWVELEREEGQGNTRKVRELAEEVRTLDARIAELARDLASALRRKDDIAEQAGISTEWAEPGIDLLHLLKDAVASYPDFEGRVSGPLEEFVRIGLGTSVSGPDLSDLLDMVAIGEPGPVTARSGDDVASLELPRTGSSPDALAADLRRFFGLVDRQTGWDRAGQVLCPLDWLTTQGVASLLSVAFGFDPEHGPLTVDRVKKTRQAYWTAAGRLKPHQSKPHQSE